MPSARPLARLCSLRPALASFATAPVRRFHQDPRLLRPLRLRQAFRPRLCHRAFSTTPIRPHVPDGGADSKPATSADGENDVPSYQMTFTCKMCSTRSSHRISKQGYHRGTVLISCPGCKNRHLISDHLKIFSDESVTLEDILRNKGQLVKRGALSEDGDLELWDDGTATQRVRQPPEPAPATRTTRNDAHPGASFKKDS